MIWYYDEPLVNAAIAGMLCFFNERVDLELDGELEQRPGPWSHGVKSEAGQRRRERQRTRGSFDARRGLAPTAGILGRMAIATPYTDKTDEQKAICEMVRQFADEQIIPNAEHYDHEDSFPEPIVEQMKELGLFGVTIPEEYGGMGLDLTTYAMIVEELSRGWISISGSSTRTSSAPTC